MMARPTLLTSARTLAALAGVFLTSATFALASPMPVAPLSSAPASQAPAPSTPAAQQPAPTAGAAKPSKKPAKRPPRRPKPTKPRVIASGPSQPPAPTAAPDTASPAGRPDVVAFAETFLGVPYAWAGASPAGFDCSGLAMYVWARFGVGIPHYTKSIWTRFPRVTDALRPGDLVFFGLGHMGIYAGAGDFIHAPHRGEVVRRESMAPGSWYGKRYSGAVRPAA